MYAIKSVRTEEDLQELYKDNSFTFVDFSIGSDSLSEVVAFMKEAGVLKDEIKTVTFDVVSGAFMNRAYSLVGDTKYKDHINIVAIKLGHFKDIHKLALIKLQIGARWFNDIVDNNAVHNHA